MNRIPNQKIYYKLVVDGKTLDIFPCTSSRNPHSLRRLAKLKGIELSSSSYVEFLAFQARFIPSSEAIS